VRAAIGPIQLDDGAVSALADAVAHPDAASDGDADADAASDGDTDADAASDGDTDADAASDGDTDADAAYNCDAYAAGNAHADAAPDRDADAATDAEGDADAGARRINRTPPPRRHGSARHRDRDRGVFVSSRNDAMHALQRECPENAGLIKRIRMRYNKDAESDRRSRNNDSPPRDVIRATVRKSTLGVHQ
jgi:hypothetical protein